MVPFRGASNRFQQNYEASVNYQESMDQMNIPLHNGQNQDPNSNQQPNIHQMILYQNTHQVVTRKISDDFNHAKWSPEDEEISQLKDCELAEELADKLKFQTVSKKSNLKNPLILQFTDNKTPPMMVTFLEDLQDINSIRYRQVQKLQLKQELMKKFNYIPYERYAALSAQTISEYSHQIFHWGANGVCAIGLEQIVYLVKPTDPEMPVKQIICCNPPNVVKSVRWMNPQGDPDSPEYCCVLAIATDESKGFIQIWETRQLQLLRTINSTQSNFTSLSWNHQLLASVSMESQLVINYVNLRNSEVAKLNIPSMGIINHCSFSQDGLYLSICGRFVQIYRVCFSTDPCDFDNSITLNKIFQFDQNIRESNILQVSWSSRTPQLFSFAIQKNKYYSSQRQYQEQTGQDQYHEILFYNIESGQQITSLNIESRPTTLQFSMNHYGTNAQSQMLFAGLENGKVAIIRIKGAQAMVTSVVNYLEFHESSILHLQESPDGCYLGSIASDQIFFLWKHMPLNPVSSTGSKSIMDSLCTPRHHSKNNYPSYNGKRQHVTNQQENSVGQGYNQRKPRDHSMEDAEMISFSMKMDLPMLR
ncbi:anaphase-promoting complex subunit cdc20-like [Stylonychia lemnae]|uniref:Anaphase-promoting complex subunit cdc20-like n=1 Tax=Stylonychia lemnae TaxID=5949 RepID=A0A078A298_STYLE|nr:anaphase-promoting complex subunit cdc20-like [Stylonychia lemnae]|eukprot:CDW75633.1 anaphase-promoting complex subunit cdc20-like [Stylonychia lemnae]